MADTDQILLAEERALQETFSWERSVDFDSYNTVLGHYQAQACLEQARGKSLLDMPCGDGFLTAIMAPRFERVVGLDAGSQHLEEARRRLPGADIHHALIEEFETGERFDTITMLNVLEHVVDPIAVLRKASSLLSDEGILLVHVPNARAANREIAVLMGTLESCEELSPFDIQVAGHRRSYSLESLTADVELAGLKVVASGGVFYKMLSTPQIDWFLKNGPWEEGGFGWGRIGAEPRDWKAEFCRACYEYGKAHPTACNIVWVGISRE